MMGAFKHCCPPESISNLHDIRVGDDTPVNFVYWENMCRKIVFILFSLCIVVPVSFAGQRLKVGISCYNTDDCSPSEFKAVLAEMYARSGIEVEFIVFPTSRAVQEVSCQGIDACMSRYPLTAEQYSGIIPVPFPLSEFSCVAATTKKGIVVTSWDDLRNYRIGLMRGVLIDEYLAKKHAVRYTLVNSYNNGLAMLQEGRVDVFVGIPELMKEVIRPNGVTLYFSEPIFRGYSYHYLSEKHRALAPRLARSLKEMLEDGTTRRLLGKYQTFTPKLPLELDR